jgi:DNA-directed RNA polymerase subunit RPC12/RpoP
MSKFLVCSECFDDMGLKIMAYKLGVKNEMVCPNCSEKIGHKLNKNKLEKLAYEFYVRGSMHRVNFGMAPVIQFNKYQYQNNSNMYKNSDMKLIEDKLKIGFFLYAPKMWMVGQNDKLKKLKHTDTRKSTIMEIIDLYPTKEFKRNDDFFRAGFDVPPGFRVFDEKAGAFDHDVHAQFFPRECSWPFADGERLNFSAVDNECVVALGFDSALEAALRRVILKQVSKIFSGNEVVNCDHFDFAAQQALFNKGAKDKATDAAESVNSNFCSHLTSVF